MDSFDLVCFLRSPNGWVALLHVALLHVALAIAVIAWD